MTAPALELLDVRKRFGDVVALDGASLVVRPGTVHALLGENGAGKTTLMRVAFGMVRADAGVTRVEGRARRFASPADAIAAGLGMVHQHFALVPAMTVAENVALGGRGRFDAAEAAERVRDVARRSGLALDPSARAASLSVAGQQRLEIVKALAREARLLVLDEPTAVLAPAEAAELLAWVRAFAGGGGSVVLITHKLREALGAADDLTVLRDGATVYAASAAESSEEALASAMLGAPPRAHHDAAASLVRNPTHPAVTTSPPRPVVLALRGVAVADERGVIRLRDATCEVRAGEIVGVAGVEGGGQRELLRALAGRLRPAEGRVEAPPAVGFVPEDRHRDAMVLDFTLVENVALRGAGARRGVVPWSALAAATRALVERHDVRAAGPRARARTLSGGNQQKLVLAREIEQPPPARSPGDTAAGAPPALVVESPTRGLDIRASAAVHDRLRAARDAGAAVVVYSSDLEEVLALADRVLACYGGRVREVPRDRDAVGRAILGLEPATVP
jgi:general nucleoside transport system ATP-binding protein